MLYPNGEFSLGLSTLVKNHKAPQGASSRERGTKPQTTHSKRMVRNCIARLERLHGKHNLAFATYTLPGLSPDEMSIIRENWSEVTRQFKQTIERELKKGELEPQIVYVTEIQEKRYQETGESVPHIHAVFQSRKTRGHKYVITTKRNTEIWNRIISNVLGRRIDMPSAASIEPIKKSAECYMSKYMSKGAKTAKDISESVEKKWVPKVWWGVTNTLRNWVKENCKLLSHETKQFIKENFRWFQENIDISPFSWLYLHTIKKQDNGQEVDCPVAIVGRVRRDWIRNLDCHNLLDKKFAIDKDN